MSHSKQPGAQTLARLASPQVLKQGQEGFLQNFFAIRWGQSKAEEVAQQPVTKLIEELDHFLLKRRGPLPGPRSIPSPDEIGGTEDVRLRR
jgi:hypothetical protein